MLIYEKRTAGTERRDYGTFVNEPSATHDGVNVCTHAAGSKADCREKDSCKKRKTYRKTIFAQTCKRRSLLKRTAFFVVAAAVLCCLDIKLFDGKFFSAVSEAVKNTVVTAYGEDVAESRDIGTRILYTLDYAEINQDRNSDAPYVSETDAATNQSVQVNASVEEAYVDGTGFFPITSLDLSCENLYSLNNGTNFSPDMEGVDKLFPSALSGLSGNDEPLVLVLHTHACESYTEYEDMYPEDEPTRNDDPEKNMVRVGKEITETLTDFGISALHCTKLHDKDSFINAYGNSAASVREYLEKYPSIRFVIDVHRDAVIKEGGESIKAVTEIAGENYAQLMFVVGTNQLGHNHPGWQDNLSLAIDLQRSVSDTYPSLCRSINLRDVPFNQQLSSGYLLLEVGTSANTLDEALRSARAFGENLARLINGAM